MAHIRLHCIKGDLDITVKCTEQNLAYVRDKLEAELNVQIGLTSINPNPKEPTLGQLMQRDRRTPWPEPDYEHER